MIFMRGCNEQKRKMYVLWDTPTSLIDTQGGGEDTPTSLIDTQGG